MKNFVEFLTKINFEKELERELRERFLSVYAFLEDIKFAKYQSNKKLGEYLISLLVEDAKENDILLVHLYYAYKVTRAQYLKKRISMKTFYKTMKCFPRFIKETKEETGKMIYDRAFWTTRQLSLHLFCIGELEFERVRNGISIHIPSKCNFTKEQILSSIRKAKVFFKKHYQLDRNTRYSCFSWLLSKKIEDVIKKDGNIAEFRSLFEIKRQFKNQNEDVKKWVFQNHDLTKINPEHFNSLQKGIYQKIKNGCDIGVAYGILK